MTLNTLPPGFIMGDGSTAGATVRTGWKRLGWVATLVTVSLVVLAILVFTQAPSSTAPLSTNNARPEGARAVAEILRQQGVDVTESSTLSGASEALGADGTLVIASYYYLDEDQIASILEWPGPVVWLAPEGYDLGYIHESLVYGIADGETPVHAQCNLPAAQTADTIVAPGPRINLQWSTAAVSACFVNVEYGSVLVRITRTPAEPMSVIAAPSLLTNKGLATSGNAALALHTLGTTDKVAWYMGTLYDSSTLASGGQEGVALIAPAWVNAAALAAALVFLMAGLWRGRRVGPLMTEPLPVVVPASEATRGRARLYRRGRAFGHAAAALRAGSARRLAQRLGLGPHADRATLAFAVAASSSADVATVDSLIFGPPPRDEAAMLDVVRRLDALESEVDPT
ncbi:MAG: hypothetical protein CVT68_00605 [Actinobacteria bacterium HGW-Actinobacteria-8]|nr:MAG: hypothetical protein CVT68_00605 [Actinobacteria bacterium HGW-Actinobacteria-8]